LTDVASQFANPEALINAAVAAVAARDAAYQGFMISIITLGVVLFIGLAMMSVAWKFSELERNTNSMKDALIETTRKLALIEGRVLGKAEAEEEGKK